MCVGLMKKYFNIGVLRQCEKSLKYKTRKFLQYPLPTLNKETPNNGQLTQQWIIGVFLVGHLRPLPLAHSSL